MRAFVGAALHECALPDFAPQKGSLGILVLRVRVVHLELDCVLRLLVIARRASVVLLWIRQELVALTEYTAQHDFPLIVFGAPAAAATLRTAGAEEASEAIALEVDGLANSLCVCKWVGRWGAEKVADRVADKADRNTESKESQHIPSRA